MKPINIELTSAINTDNEHLFQSQPSFKKKNSLVYKGLLSNLTSSAGDGILSTTGKNIKIDGNNLIAGEQSFSIPTDRWVVEDSGSKTIGTDEVCIKGYVAGCTNDYMYITDTDGNISKQSFELATNTTTRTWTTTMFNKDIFVFAKFTDNQLEIYTTQYNDITSYRRDYLVDGNKTYGNRMYACYITATNTSGTREEEVWAYGFDDDDYRKRYCWVRNNNNWGLIRGFGCLSPNGVLTGEPVLRHNREFLPFGVSGSGAANNVTHYINKSGDNVWNQLNGPDIDNDSRYKVLANGVISVWTGWVNPNTNSSHISSGTSFLKLICDENAAIGESLTSNSGTQAGTGIDEWHWKIHRQLGLNADDNYTNGVQENNERIDGLSYDDMNDSDMKKYMYSFHQNGGGTYSKGIETAGASLRWQWIYAINLSRIGRENYFGSLESEEKIGMIYHGNYSYNNASTTVSNGGFKPNTAGGLDLFTILGDYSYIFNSMKPYSETTDYDSVFPCLRVFFNNASARGKYWDYGVGYCSHCVTEFGWSLFSKELSLSMTPPLIHFLDTNTKSDYSCNVFNTYTRSSDELTTLIERSICDRKNNYSIMDGLQNNKYISYKPDSANVMKTYWEQPDYITTATDVWTTIADGVETQHVQYDEYMSGYSYSSYGFRILARPLKILGEGKGISEPTFTIGGMGDSSVLDMLNTSINITPNHTADLYQKTNEYEDYLRMGLYNGLQTALSFKGTLLYNLTDYDGRIWVNYGDDYYDITVYNDNKAQWCRIKHNGEVKVDKLTDYLFRLNILGSNNLLQEGRDGNFELVKGFDGFIGEYRLNVADLRLQLDNTGIGSNNQLLYAQGKNSNMDVKEEPPTALFPAITVDSYIASTDTDYFESEVLKNRKGFIKNCFTNGMWNDDIDVYYTSTQSSTDLTYKETDTPLIGDQWEDSQPVYSYTTGIQAFDSRKDGFTYWIDSDTVIYPVGIASKVSGINYATSTIDLPGNYAVRFYSQNNKTWAVYNQNSQVYFGNNIFTIMGSNYYFDGQGVYYLGSQQSGGNSQYSSNILIAYAVGMKYLCNAPSEAYFYSSFDKHLYIFTSSNTMQKSTSLAKFGEVIDSCYCPVNQSLYILFDGKLIIKSQDDMAIIDVEGNALQTTADGVQVIEDNSSYVIHSPYKYDELIPLDIETEWLGTPDALNQYSFVDMVFYGDTTANITVELQTIAEGKIISEPKQITIKSKDWVNNMFRVRLSPKEPIGNAFRAIIYSDDKVGLYNLTVYMDTKSMINAAQGNR